MITQARRGDFPIPHPPKASKGDFPIPHPPKVNKGDMQHRSLKKAPPQSSVPYPAAPRETPSKPPSVLHDLGMLALKIGVFVVIAIVLFTFVYGFHYNSEPGMNPAIKDGDLVLYYRLSKDYDARDLALVNFRGETQVRRVIATAGDTVDITEDGLIINGSLQQEQEIFEETELYLDGPAFPMTLGPNQIFVLGDSREHATDSRLYGPIYKEDTLGKAITILRRRNF